MSAATVERTCACGETLTPRTRGDACSRCYSQAYRRRQYHERVKVDPERLDRHREQCRQANAALRDRRRAAGLPAVSRKPKEHR